MLGFQGYGFSEIQEKIHRQNLESEVFMPGYIPEEDIPMLYRGSDLFVFPSFYEGFGIPLLQAMACGVPILAARAGAIPEVVRNAAILVEPSDIGMMAEEMERVLKDPALRMRLRGMGLERVHAFSWQLTARQTLDFIRSVFA